MLEPFVLNPFMANALLAGAVVSVACGIVGTFMVLRGLAFIGDALAHGVFPGIAVALLLGYPGILGAAAGSALMVGGIGYITRRSRLSNDTAIGLFFVGMLALGVITVSRSSSFSGDLVRVLFGELLGITPQGIMLQAGATILIAAVTILLRRPFLLLCFDPEQADVSGFPARRHHAIMLAMIALTIVVSFQTVGTLLVFGMLLAPAAASALVSRRLLPMMVIASLIGMISVYTGLLVSYHFNLAAGAAITLAATTVFFAAFAVSRLSPEAGMSAVVSCRGLSVGYGTEPVVDGIELDLSPGGTLALVGVNGSGKSTFLKTIIGLLKPLSGDITVFGGEPGRSPARVAFLSQFHKSESILPFRAIDIVRMARYSSLGLLGRTGKRDEDLVRAAMETMGVAELSNEPLHSLSGGQRQRVFLAQTLARDAELLLLDEPTTNLDAAGTASYQAALKGAVRMGRTAVIATHDIEDASGCDFALLLARRVVAYGPGSTVLTPSSLLETFGVAIRMADKDVVVAERTHRHEAGE